MDVNNTKTFQNIKKKLVDYKKKACKTKKYKLFSFRKIVFFLEHEKLV